MDDPEIIEIRCPVGPQRLFAKFRLEGGVSPHVTDDNLVEFACSDCKKEVVKKKPYVTRVLHRYNFFGDLVESAFETNTQTASGR